LLDGIFSSVRGVVSGPPSRAARNSVLFSWFCLKFALLDAGHEAQQQEEDKDAERHQGAQLQRVLNETSLVRETSDEQGYGEANCRDATDQEKHPEGDLLVEFDLVWQQPHPDIGDQGYTQGLTENQAAENGPSADTDFTDHNARVDKGKEPQDDLHHPLQLVFHHRQRVTPIFVFFEQSITAFDTMAARPRHGEGNGHESERRVYTRLNESNP